MKEEEKAIEEFVRKSIKAMLICLYFITALIVFFSVYSLFQL